MPVAVKVNLGTERTGRGRLLGGELGMLGPGEPIPAAVLGGPEWCLVGSRSRKENAWGGARGGESIFELRAPPFWLIRRGVGETCGSYVAWERGRVGGRLAFMVRGEMRYPGGLGLYSS